MYCTLRTQKLKDRKKITEAASHNFRLRHQGNIDATRSQLNSVLVNNLGADLTRAEGLQEAISAHYKAIGAKENKDSVLAQEFVISASPEFFTGKSRAEVDEWASHQVEFMRKEFGGNLQVAVLHMDERTPHLHFLLSCDEKSLKRYKNRHGECFKEKVGLNANRWGPDFLVGLHDRHARHNEVFGLKRGQPGSKAKHKPVKEYYRDLAKLERRLSQKAEQVEMVPELIEVIDVLAESIEGLDPPNRQLARLAKLASRLVQKARGGVPPEPPRGLGMGGG